VGSHIDLDTCTRLGIAVAEGVGSPVAPAELTWALIMAAMRRLPQYIGNLKHGAWQQSGLKAASMPSNFGVGMVLRGKTLGIWGFGKIGQLLAGYGRAFGMQVVVWGREASLERALADGYEAAATREALFEQRRRAQRAPAPGGRHARTDRAPDDLARMKPTALFVNTSRAELVQEERAGVRTQPRAGRAWRRWTCSRPNPSCRGIPCCGWKMPCARRTWATCEQDS
jgi:D-3-phosphoglycerate dehydrogenase